MWKHLSCICINNTHNQISPAYTELSIKHKHDQFMLSSVSSQIPPVPTSWLCLARYGSRLWKWSGEGSVTAGGSNESINCSRTDQSQLVSLYLASKKVLPSSHPSKSQHHLKHRIWNQRRVLCSFRNLPQPGRQIHPQVNLTLDKSLSSIWATRATNHWQYIAVTNPDANKSIGTVANSVDDKQATATQQLLKTKFQRSNVTM